MNKILSFFKQFDSFDWSMAVLAGILVASLIIFAF